MPGVSSTTPVLHNNVRGTVFVLQHGRGIHAQLSNSLGGNEQNQVMNLHISIHKYIGLMQILTS